MFVRVLLKHQRLSPGFGRNIHMTRYCQGITDTIMDTFRSKVDQSKDKSFKNMMDIMAETPEWNMKLWKVTLEAQSKDWTMYIPGVSSTDQAKSLKATISILDAMHDEELQFPETVKGPNKVRIAASAGCTVEEVSNLLLQFKQSRVVHVWLKMKKGKGERMPTTQRELVTMQNVDPRVRTIATKIMNPGGIKERSGRRRRAF